MAKKTKNQGAKYYLHLTSGLISLLTVIILSSVKFAEGTWLVVIGTPIVAVIMLKFNDRYAQESKALLLSSKDSRATSITRHDVTVLVDRIDIATVGAVRYARSLNPRNLNAVHFVIDDLRAARLAKAWAENPAFDDMGSKFSADGSFSNWWNDEDLKKFTSKTQILGQTYAAFCPIDGHCVNPELTMGENIADLGGLILAFNAYKKTREFKKQKKIYNFTPSQRFFISAAQIFKINFTEQELKNRLANDSHSPGMFRVNGTLKNCTDFFDAFDLKDGDPMRNSKDKLVEIW